MRISLIILGSLAAILLFLLATASGNTTVFAAHEPRDEGSEAEERSRERRAARRHCRFSIHGPGVWNLSLDDPGFDTFVSTRRRDDENRNDEITVASRSPNISWHRRPPGAPHARTRGPFRAAGHFRGVSSEVSPRPITCVIGLDISY